MKNGVSADVERFILENFEAQRSGERNSLLSTMLCTEFSLVGTGAPIRIFLEDVAKMLGTHAVIPEHYEVANALGAVIGSIGATCEIEIQPLTKDDGEELFVVYGSEKTASFEELDEAIAYAKAEAEQKSREEAKKRGATGELTVTAEVKHNNAEAYDCTIYLGTTVTAKAIGGMENK